ncbi:murein hydrolase lrga [Bacillus sp. OxB-1]|uniref:CidA/LrgA family holin-like protein n=1 Tax=Bacillus sp. (strain OxB-1) TaxID=98228 RepID=UPI000581C04D|nr:CidA/LrgA family holin-like protein [Bacillus sp. OxB-1]BAQ09615.1 murein hydrolase lrga [Bacillus sp. OxB-1]
MKLGKYALQVILLLGFFAVGQWLQQLLHIPLPGSILGLLLLWMALLLKVIPLRWVEGGSYLFLSVLPIFFIPATVGVMNFGSFFLSRGVVLIPLTIIGTFLTMWVAGFVSQSIASKISNRKEEAKCKS